MTAPAFIVAAISGLTVGYAAAVVMLLAPDIAAWWSRRKCIAAIAREISHG